MKDSRRSKRMQRSHKRHKRGGALNLVSLMDIFTILVFFLLVNSSDGEVLPGTKNVELPESISEHRPEKNLVIMVTNTHILVQGQKVVALNNIAASELMPSLQKTLEIQRAKQIDNSGNPTLKSEVTIMGDKNTPYKILKKVMLACTEAGYERISLAVLQKAAKQS